MAKSRKTSRDYSKYFKAPTTELPLPEEVNEKVVEITQPQPKTTPTPQPAPVVEEQAPVAAPIVQQPPVTLAPQPAPIIASKRGRKPLEEPKVPYTTAITEDHKYKLKLLAMQKKLRPSDMLHEILKEYFGE